MRSSDAQNTDEIADFYREYLLPLAEKVRDLEIEIFPLGPEKDVDSYFNDRSDESDYVHSIDATEMVKELKTFWANDRVPEMAVIAGPLLELAELLREKEEEASDEISPFIYAMF